MILESWQNGNYSIALNKNIYSLDICLNSCFINNIKLKDPESATSQTFSSARDTDGHVKYGKNAPPGYQAEEEKGWMKILK